MVQSSSIVPTHQNDESTTRNFTMVFIDLDDTLIPTTIRNSLRVNYGFELFNVMKMDTDTLQLDIINSINKIKNTIDPHNDVQFALVSDASASWIKQMVTIKDAKMPILAKYLKLHEIPTVSAPEVTTKYLRDKYGANRASETISTKYNDNRFMFKYMSFSMLIHKYSHKLNAKCTRVISIGDGIHEHKAMELLSKRHNDINAISIRLRRAPTLTQLSSEWKYIDNNFDSVLDSAAKKANESLYEIDVDDQCTQDNNAFCTGTYQLNAIAQYFNMFMKMLNLSTKEFHETTLQAVCKVVYANLTQIRKSSHRYRGDQFKEMFKIAVKNQEFSESMSKMVKNKALLVASTK